jgi:hypothetical protein
MTISFCFPNSATLLAIRQYLDVIRSDALRYCTALTGRAASPQLKKGQDRDHRIASESDDSARESIFMLKGSCRLETPSGLDCLTSLLVDGGTAQLFSSEAAMQYRGSSATTTMAASKVISDRSVRTTSAHTATCT